jgi:hypothetical protein
VTRETARRDFTQNTTFKTQKVYHFERRGGFKEGG